jgi:hypothetical protein
MVSPMCQRVAAQQTPFDLIISLSWYVVASTMPRSAFARARMFAV